jgi:hypothetical protein
MEEILSFPLVACSLGLFFFFFFFLKGLPPYGTTFMWLAIEGWVVGVG